MKHLAIIMAGLILACCSVSKESLRFSDRGKVAIVAQGGYWDCEGAGFTEESIASLRMAQKAGFWGSEIDVHLTADDVIVVSHLGKMDGRNFIDFPYSEFSSCTLKNGEHLPTLDEYLREASKGKTHLIIEIKSEKDPERNKVLVAKTIELVKSRKMLSNGKVFFIAHGLETCQMVAELCPDMLVQILSGGRDPKTVREAGLGGIDYNIRYFRENPSWIEDAHKLGLSAHAWTVNNVQDAQWLQTAGIDMITSNNPMSVRKALGNYEITCKARR